MARSLRPTGPSFGGSLAESLVVMTIGTLFLAMLPAFYLGYVKLWQRESSEIGVTQSGDFALRRMQEDVRSARSVAVSSDGTSVSLTLPLRAYDSGYGREVNVLDSQGQLVDGPTVQYYFVADDPTSPCPSGPLYRRVTLPDGTVGPEKVVAERIVPQLNPLESGTAHPVPMFAYDSAQRVLTATIAAAEFKPNTGTFAPTHDELECDRDHGRLVRIATADCPEGEIQCSVCGDQVRPTAEIAVYQSRLLVRNQ